MPPSCCRRLTRKRFVFNKEREGGGEGGRERERERDYNYRLWIRVEGQDVLASTKCGVLFWGSMFDQWFCVCV